MVVCAGDEDATAGQLQEAGEKEDAEAFRYTSESFFQCAYDLRAVHDARDPARVLEGMEAALASKQQVRLELERAKVLFDAVAEISAASRKRWDSFVTRKNPRPNLNECKPCSAP